MKPKSATNKSVSTMAKGGMSDVVGLWIKISQTARAAIILIAFVVVAGTFLVSFEAGHSAGYELGYEYGFQDGEDQGIESGRAEGMELGREAGYESGYANGKSDGLTAGKSAGEATGYRTGYEKGYYDGRDCAVRTPTYSSPYAWCTVPPQLFTPPITFP